MFDKDNLEDIINLLDEGKVILYPTDTVWSLGCDAYNEAAIRRIHEIKQRPFDKPLTLIVSSIEMLQAHIQGMHPKIETLLAYHERPLTVIYERGKRLPELLSFDNGGVAIRITRDPFCAKLIEAFGRPIIATSANLFKEEFPIHFGHISSDIITKADYIVRHRTDDKTAGEPSVMIKMSKKSELIFLRT